MRIAGGGQSNNQTNNLSNDNAADEPRPDRLGTRPLQRNPSPANQNDSSIPLDRDAETSLSGSESDFTNSQFPNFGLSNASQTIKDTSRSLLSDTTAQESLNFNSVNGGNPDPIDSISNPDVKLSSIIVYYSFAEANQPVSIENEVTGSRFETLAQNLSDYQKSRIVAAMDEFAKVTDLIFLPASENPEQSATWIVASANLPLFIDGAAELPKTDGSSQTLLLDIDGENFIEEENQFGTGPLEAGSWGFETILHELGHGVGLGHTHDDGAGTVIMEGVNSSGDGDRALNNSLNTIMSENNGGRPSSTGGYVGSLSALDIAALREKYGTPDVNNTDDVYILGDPDTTYNLPGRDNWNPYTTIVDTGGIDEIRYEGSNATDVDMRGADLDYFSFGVPGAKFSSVSTTDEELIYGDRSGPTRWLDRRAFDQGTQGGLAFANGSEIENFSGGSGSDRVRGNELDNVIVGNDGDDTFISSAGNDTYIGGEGDDSFQFTALTSDIVNGIEVQLSDSSDQYILDAYGNRDTVESVESFYLSYHADVFVGSDANETVESQLGNDTLNGGGGDDKLEGGEGYDTLIGGEGSDTFVIYDGFESSFDTIEDFTPGVDKLQFIHVSYDDIKIESGSANGSTMVFVNGIARVELKNIDPIQLVEDDFKLDDSAIEGRGDSNDPHPDDVDIGPQSVEDEAWSGVGHGSSGGGGSGGIGGFGGSSGSGGWSGGASGGGVEGYIEENGPLGGDSETVPPDDPEPGIV